MARPLPDQPEKRRQQAHEALEIVERAATLMPETQAVARRRARYLATLGQNAEAIRERARAAKDWKKSDELREKIAALGWEVRDTPSGQRLARRASPPSG